MPSSPLAFRFAAALAATTLSGGAFAAGPLETPQTAAAPAAMTAAPAESIRERAIFGVSDNDAAKWNLTLGNIANAIDGLGPGTADIELVVYGPGIAMLKKDSPVADKIAGALERGVHIAACQNSMRGAKLEPGDLAPGVGTVPSGVVELIQREHAGWAYVRS